MKLVGKCPKCGSKNLQICWIGTCTQEIDYWDKAPNPNWTHNPVYGELGDWNMEWEDETPFFCPDCGELFEYEAIVFEKR